MIYIILLILGIIGVVTTLWMSHPKLYTAEHPTGDAWYVLHPENLESGVFKKMRQTLRWILKQILIWAIAHYRTISGKITVKQVLKKKIRGFLYDHNHDSVRHPSEFWNKVRTQKKTIVSNNESSSEEIDLLK